MKPTGIKQRRKQRDMISGFLIGFSIGVVATALVITIVICGMVVF